MTDLVFEVTPRGKEELSRGDTRLSAIELELLVRTDGKLPLSRIRDAMGTTQAASSTPRS